MAPKSKKHKKSVASKNISIMVQEAEISQKWNDDFINKFSAMDQAIIEHFTVVSLSTGIMPEIIKLPKIQEKYETSPLLPNDFMYKALVDLECHFCEQMNFNTRSLEAVKFMYEYCGLKFYQEQSNLPRGFYDIVQGDTLTHFAAKHNNVELLKYLKDKDLLEVNVANDAGIYPIQYTSYLHKMGFKSLQKNQLTKAGEFLLENMGSSNIFQKQRDFTDFFSRAEPLRSTTEWQLFYKQLKDLIEEIFCIGLQKQDNYKFDLKSYLVNFDSVETGYSKDEHLYMKSLPIILNNLKYPEQTESLFDEFLMHFPADQAVILFDYIFAKGLSNDFKVVHNILTKVINSFEESDHASDLLPKCYKSLGFTEYHLQYYESSSKNLVKALEANAGLINEDTAYIITALWQSSVILNDKQYILGVIKILQKQNYIPQILSLLESMVSIADGEIDINQIFQDSNQEINLIKIFCGRKLLESNNNTNKLECSLWLELILQYALENNLLDEATGLMDYVQINKEGIQSLRFSSISLGLGHKDRIESILNLDKGSPYEAKTDIHWNITKILVSVFHNNIQQFTFDAIENVHKYMVRTDEYGELVKSSFSKGCKLVAEHLLDQEDVDFVKINEYLGLADKYGDAELRKELIGAKLLLNIKEKNISNFKVTLQELSSESESDEEISNNFAFKKYRTLIDGNEGEFLQKITDDLNDSKGKKEENALDRSAEAKYLLTRSSVLSKIAETNNEFKFHFKDKLYQSFDKIKLKFKGKEKSKDLIYKISDYAEIYGMISKEILDSLEPSIVNQCLFALSNGLARGRNKVIETDNYIKLKIDADLRLYTTEKYKGKLGDKDIVMIIFDQKGSHQIIKSLSSKVKIATFEPHSSEKINLDSSGFDTMSDFADLDLSTEVKSAGELNIEDII